MQDKGIRCKSGTVPAAVRSFYLSAFRSHCQARAGEKALPETESEDLPGSIQTTDMPGGRHSWICEYVSGNLSAYTIAVCIHAGSSA